MEPGNVKTIITECKKCTSCSISKLLSEFNKSKLGKNGLKSYCRDCQKQYFKEYHEKNTEKERQRSSKRHKEDSEKEKQYREKNREKRKQYSRKYRLENKEKTLLYRKQNKKKSNQRSVNRKKNDLNYRLSCNLRSRLWQAIKNNTKNGSAVRDLGCTIYELKKYIENSFLIGMNWENYGNGLGKWNIDHKIPLSIFDLSDREQFLKSCHYTNLQPMWAIDNIKKGNRIKNIQEKI